MNAALRRLTRLKAVRLTLLQSGLLSALSVTFTALAFVLIARVIAAALLSGTGPDILTLVTIAALLLGRLLSVSLRERLGWSAPQKLDGESLETRARPQP